MERLLQLLNSIHPLHAELADHLLQILKVKELRKKQILLRAGHVCRQICFVESGLLRCYYSKGDTEISSWFMKEGDVVVSIESFFQQVPSYESIQALEDTRVYFIEFNELQYVYREFPAFNVTGRILTERYYLLWAQQLYGLRMRRAHERYQWLLDHHSSLVLRVPAKYLASWLDITEVMLSKIKRRMSCG